MTELSQFKYVSENGEFEYATIVETTPYLFWSKRQTRRIFRKKGAALWHWADTGRFTPGTEAERAELVSKAYGT